jgi:hypothetical protein
LEGEARGEDLMSRIGLAVLLVLCAAACGAETTDTGTTNGSEADFTSDATLKLTSDFQAVLTGTPKVGGTLRIEYALERLPQCRGNLPGGAPAWNITGYYSENGGPPKTFEVTELSPDGKDRVAKPARITLTQGGDLALWFQVTNRWGCSEYDSRYGQNFHVDVEGSLPEVTASILFAKDGAVDLQGRLVAGGKVKIRYEQERLPHCRRVQGGNPLWAITGFSSVAGAPPQSFATGRPSGADREPIDAILDLPSPGELVLWFEVASVGGCHEVDSNGGQNYRFPIE